MEMYEPRWKKNPFVAVKVKGEKSKPRDFWTIEQVEAILAAEENPLLRLMYAFMAFAGLRFAEAASLTYADVFEDDGNVKRKLRILGKGGKVAFVPICTRLKEQISSTFQNPQIYPKHPNFSQFLGTAKSLKIFPQYQYNCSQNRSLKALFRRNSILASFGGEVHLHRFRHSFISNLIRANCCSIRCVADLARHENVNITLNTYSHLPFALKGTCSGFIGIIDRKYRFMENKLKVDVDYILQNLLYDRVVFFEGRYALELYIDSNSGGSSLFRSEDKIKEERAILCKKWGKYLQYKETRALKHQQSRMIVVPSINVKRTQSLDI